MSPLGVFSLSVFAQFVGHEFAVHSKVIQMTGEVAKLKVSQPNNLKFNVRAVNVTVKS